MRTKKQDIEDIQELAEQLLALIGEVTSRYDGEYDELKRELVTLGRYANIIAEKTPKLCRLRDFRGYKFAVVGDDGQVRNATHDEAMRLIMDYKQGNILDILHNWVVVDGKWVERPEFNPDGTHK